MAIAMTSWTCWVGSFKLREDCFQHFTLVAQIFVIFLFADREWSWARERENWALTFNINLYFSFSLLYIHGSIDQATGRDWRKRFSPLLLSSFISETIFNAGGNLSLISVPLTFKSNYKSFFSTLQCLSSSSHHRGASTKVQELFFGPVNLSRNSLGRSNAWRNYNLPFSSTVVGYFSLKQIHKQRHWDETGFCNCRDRALRDNKTEILLGNKMFLACSLNVR